MEFLETSEKLTLKELEEVEDQLGISFTEDFKNHYLKYNGGYPVKENYLWPDGAKTRINHFFSIIYPGISQLEKTYMDLFVLEQVLPVGFLPFASDDGGDFFVFPCCLTAITKCSFVTRIITTLKILMNISH